MKNTNYISVIIPVYNHSELLEKTLNALSNQSYPKSDYEIIVVDNASSENMNEVMSKFKNVKFVSENNIQGSYAARNKGVSVATGNIYAFTDADCVPHEDWLLNGVKCLTESGADFIGGPVSFTHPDIVTASHLWDALHQLNTKRYIEKHSSIVTANALILKNSFRQVGNFNKT